LNTVAQYINQLLIEAKDAELYTALIAQLNKDFILAGLSIGVENNLPPKELQQEVYTIVTHLINTNFEGFLSLLYRIDLSEEKIKSISKDDFDSYINQVSFLILKREWMKVWYRKKYS